MSFTQDVTLFLNTYVNLDLTLYISRAVDINIVINNRLHNKFHLSTYVGDIAKMFRKISYSHLHVYFVYIIAL